MRPVDKNLYQCNKEKYDPYGDAKEDLIKAIGPFCSYCERYGYYSALDVEHIEDKENNPSKEHDWDNFLLACKNCNPIKGNKPIKFPINGTSPIEYEYIMLPHLDNTFELFDYLESGHIKINPSISDHLKKEAKKLIELVGLDRRPGHRDYSNKDKRYRERKKAWEMSQRYLTKYQKNNCEIEMITDLASANGFWSIWMHTFTEYPEVQKELINAFPGTRKEFFGT